MTVKRPEEYLKQINMPKLCARCGSEPDESTWPIYSRYNFSFNLLRTTYKKSRFYVPVCYSCRTQLEMDNGLWLKISWISGTGIIVMLVLTILIYEYSVLFLILSLLALTSLIIAFIKRSKYWRDSGIGTYDGKHFTFNNKTFQKQFGELNPSLVRKT